MKMKQVLAVVLISATTTVGALWGYNRFMKNEPYLYTNVGSADSGKAPAN